MSTQAIISVLESVLGPSSKGAKGNIKLSCPFQGCANRPSKLAGEKKLEVQVEGIDDGNGKISHPFHCWSCGTKGKTLFSLLKGINAPEHIVNDLKSVLKYTDFNNTHSDKDKKHFNGRLPQEYRSFLSEIKTTDLEMRHGSVYLKKRKINKYDIMCWDIGFCETGEYNNRILTPSYDSNMKTNLLVGRTIKEDVKPKYLYPDTTRDIIPFDSHINWSRPIVLVEGKFDMFAVKRNCIPLLGKDLQPTLLSKMLTCKNKKYYIAIDKDALKQAVKYAELLMSAGKIVYIVEMPEKDPSEMGFKAFTELIQNSTRLTPSKLFKLKIQVA